MIVGGPRRSSAGSETAVHQVGSGTLLTRDQDGNFVSSISPSWSWLVARAAAKELRQSQHRSALELRELSPLVVDFFIALAGADLATEWQSASFARWSATRRSRTPCWCRVGWEWTSAPINLAGKICAGKTCRAATYATRIFAAPT